MNTRADHRAIVRHTGFVLFDKFAARICNRYKAWRARQIESANTEALAALGPELLDDVGAPLHKAGKPPKSIAICNPHLIAMDSLSMSRPTERGEF